MSEFQFVAFRAIDQAVNEKNLEYMRKQSTRAEITPWSFENEYHYGDFRGNAFEMMRRGYDIHFHFANFGIRKLAIRLPYGFPNATLAKKYLTGGLFFDKDKQGPGGILCIEPSHDSDGFDDLFNCEDVLDQLVPLRDEILNGDLRPLYLAQLAVLRDDEHDRDESKGGPVPAGLEKLTDAQSELADLYDLGGSLLKAAAKGTPRVPEKVDDKKQHVEWLQKQSTSTKDNWLVQLMSEPRSVIGREILAAFRNDRTAQVWPTINLNRTMAELEHASDEIQKGFDDQAAMKAARDKAKRMAAIAADPDKILKETEKLVALRSTENYRKISRLLSELREALINTSRSDLAEQQAKKLKRENPTLRTLTSELRRAGFLPK